MKKQIIVEMKYILIRPDDVLEKMKKLKKQSPVYIDLRCFIIDKSWCVCDSVMQLVHKPGA